VLEIAERDRGRGSVGLQPGCGAAPCLSSLSTAMQV